MTEHSEEFLQHLTKLKDSELRKALTQHDELIEHHRSVGTEWVVKYMEEDRAAIEAELKRREEGYRATSELLGGLLGPVWK